jgi:hypothetical protein
MARREMSPGPMVSTYSMWSLFRNCRKAVEWRYLQQLVPIQRDRNLHFGSLLHECLQTWHQRRDLGEVLALIDRLCPNRVQDENQLRDWHLAAAMMKAYAARYATEEFEIVALEKTFEGPIVNPATGAPSRSFQLAGKVDGIVRIGGNYLSSNTKPPDRWIPITWNASGRISRSPSIPSMSSRRWASQSAGFSTTSW